MMSKFWKSGVAVRALACVSWVVLGCTSMAPADGDSQAGGRPTQDEGTLSRCTHTPGMVTICGTVVDEAGMPLAGATAELGGQRALTAPDGSFSVSVPTRSQVTFTLSALGHMPYSTNVDRDVLGRSFGLAGLHQQRFLQLEPVSVVDPNTGAGVQLDLRQLMNPQTGNPPLSPVTVGVRYLDSNRVPMPGDDGAINRFDERVFLTSFGVIYVEVRDASQQLMTLQRGSEATVLIPITRDREAIAPPGIALWTQEPGTGTWVQQPSGAQRTFAGPPAGCSPPGSSCAPDNCTTIGPTRYTGRTRSLGYVNADVENRSPACLTIEVDGSMLLPGMLPVCLDIKIPVGSGAQTRQVCAEDGQTVLVNLPPDVELTVRRTGGVLGCMAPMTSSSVQVNTGAPWGGTGLPPSPSVCNGKLFIPPLP